MSLSGRSNAETGGNHAFSEPSTPCGHDEVRPSDGEGAGQMDRIGTAERVRVGQLAGVALNGGRELHRLGCRPERLPVPSGDLQGTGIDSTIASGRGESRPNLRVRETARHGGVATVPQGRGEVAPVLINHQLYERAGVEVDERHAKSAALLANQVSHRPCRRNPAVATGLGSRFPIGTTNHPLGDQSLEKGSGIDTEEAGDRYPTVGHEDLLSGSGAFDPLAEVGPEGAHGDVHPPSVHLSDIWLYMLLEGAPGPAIPLDQGTTGSETTNVFQLPKGLIDGLGETMPSSPASAGSSIRGGKQKGWSS